MKRWIYAAALAATGLAAGCAVVPDGPSVMAMPGNGKTFDQFRADDATCRQYAYYQVGGGGAQQSANNAAVGSAALGTALGALAGVAIGGGHGAAVGAGAGLLAGSAIGASNAQASGYGIQQRYDQAYVQCMYAKGERVPVRGHFVGGGYGGDGDYDQGYGRGGYAPPPPPGPPPGVPPGAY